MGLPSQKKIILFALSLSVLLMLGKFTAFFVTQSNAILTDAAESIVNVLASAFAFYSIYLSIYRLSLKTLITLMVMVRLNSFRCS
jgi:divalent metal cation (Fe/Co/Zn/Cd) transporter